MASSKTSHKKAAAAPPRTNGSSSYRDDSDAVSMHTTRSDYEYDDAPELPSYSDSVATDNAAALPNDLPPADEYRTITQPNAISWRGRTKDNGCPAPSKAVGTETSIRIDDRLLDPKQLYDYVDKYLRAIPPRPHVRIQGWHYETRKDQNNKKSTEREYDFDIVLGMQAYFPNSLDPVWTEADTVDNGTQAFRGSFRKTRAPGSKQDIEVGDDPKPDLMAWCEDFTMSKSALRVFRVTRNIVGWDTETLKDNIVPVIRSTHYRGHIDISFPVADKNVDIYTPHWVNNARLSWVRWIFYLSFLWIFTWPILYFLTKWWTVYKIDWRYSAPQIGQSERSYCTLSEKHWLQKHSNLIRSLVLDKFQGDGTDLPVDVEVDLDRRRSGIMPQTGNRNVDAAVNFLHGGVSAWNTLNGRGDSGSGGWGGDSS